MRYQTQEPCSSAINLGIVLTLEISDAGERRRHKSQNFNPRDECVRYLVGDF